MTSDHLADEELGAAFEKNRLLAEALTGRSKKFIAAKLNHTQRENNSPCSRTRDGICGNAIQSSVQRITRQSSCCPLTQGKETIMANLSKVILGATIAAISIASPALAAHKAKPSAHENGYVTRSGASAFASVPRSVDDPAGRPYVYVPGEAVGSAGGF